MCRQPSDCGNSSDTKGRENVSDDETVLAMSIPLDSDGFIRRECPTCERELKWLVTPQEQAAEAEPVQDGGYFCPYCGVQAQPDTWLTQAQAELAQNMVATEVAGPLLKKFNDDLKRTSQRSRGMLKVETTYSPPAKLGPLTETDDMLRVDFECHPSEPVKIIDSWTDAPYCIICGARSS